ncbi:hypothetical protein LTR10_018345 [Elasticomyces elasticus]|uniref:Uncharacterized protein n=1 Tax=Exophiala sideris TaxID=1016849 RepID=A0ABR0J0G4_9EURO|nr:hypothetical protein LTR10_018345 [Elasticomyces elasticus]KAK5023213.1 hypothetical protein LTS07_009435 [Exophiala sideris]KAK5028585.1 hypothetical protein LTR13_009036 [Exophiala sideris]KAK5052963.1 hypothetical protein LTR69_009532 [Exophiala sideris]KAK5178703.1 hypothetical protein LTR44_008817 [Eurotiomycetes sp. CCFEE 6388]
MSDPTEGSSSALVSQTQAPKLRLVLPPQPLPPPNPFLNQYSRRKRPPKADCTSTNNPSSATTTSSQTVPASSSSRVPTPNARPVLPSSSPAIQQAIPQVADTRGPESPKEQLSEATLTIGSQLRPLFLQSRLQKAKTRKDELSQSLADVKREAEKTDQKLEELRACQEQARVAQQERESAIEKARRALQEAQEKYEGEVDSLSRTQDVVKDFSTTIRTEEERISRCRSNEEDIADEIESIEREREQAARQAEILNLTDFEINTLGKHAASNTAFYDKLVRAAEGTATDVMCRDIKSKLFETLTSVTEDELGRLARGFLAVTEKLVPGSAAEKGVKAPLDHNLSTTAGTRKRKAHSLYPNTIAGSQHSSDSESSQHSVSSDEQMSEGNEQEIDSDEQANYSDGQSRGFETFLQRQARVRRQRAERRERCVRRRRR